MARQYASTAEYQLWAGAAAGTEVDDALLRRASAAVDELLVGVAYPTDAASLPTRPAHVEAIRDATCALAQWFNDLGDTSGVGAVMGGASIGSLQLPSRATGTGTDTARQDSRYAPEAVRALRTAGLGNRAVHY